MQKTLDYLRDSDTTPVFLETEKSVFNVFSDVHFARDFYAEKADTRTSFVYCPLRPELKISVFDILRITKTDYYLEYHDDWEFLDKSEQDWFIKIFEKAIIKILTP